jgi:hypothetical protein
MSDTELLAEQVRCLFKTVLYIMRQTKNPYESYVIAAGVMNTFKQIVKTSCEIVGKPTPEMDAEKTPMNAMPKELLFMLLNIAEGPQEETEKVIDFVVERFLKQQAEAS